MNFKTLLLGSAAVIVSAAGSAQAADLSVAEPVDYVRVCDAFGEGYFYIPGTDTCISISGRIDFGIKFGDSYPVDGHDFETYTRTELNVTAKSQTDWGPLTAFITWRGDHEYDRSDYGSDFVVLDEAFLTLGPITAGFTQSIFDVHGGGYTDEGYDLSDYTVNQLALSWAFNGFGLAIALEEPKDYWGSSADDVPVLSAALSTSMSGWDAALSFQYDAAAPGDDWIGVEGVVETEIGMWQFKLGALWVDYGSSYWVVNGSSRQNWQSNFYTAETVFYDDDAEEWGAAFTIAYSPVDSLWVLANAQTADEGDNWNYKIFLKKTFGPNS